ncbi:hypothetical protein DAPPUDRAFT_96940 [Daphnia pulex]|uniref:Uncharacterized protein n=1 Tax=Daphnia pulex TaxID=6669 RepID=E9G039_DAPPU|nr:hypothetical protein DAPPUDRAFT_96940 [Daphnia pulex]|eukprot:EFX86831.1 hypothetical protein DAPPUDRAFT_96940 [Daphnia pulex]
MESTLSVDKSRPAVQQQQQQQPKQPKQVELAESEDVSLVNESGGSYERHGSSSSGQQLGAQLPLEPGYQVKATKSVLFDTRSTTHAHNKKVQSGYIHGGMYGAGGGHCVSLLMRSAKPHSTAGDGYSYSRPNRPKYKEALIESHTVRRSWSSSVP